MPPYEETKELVRQEVKKQLKLISILLCAVSILSITTSFIQIKSINRYNQRIKEEKVSFKKDKNVFAKLEDMVQDINSRYQIK